MNDLNVRVEHDSIGPINVPELVLWGAQTQRCLEFFAIGSAKMPYEMLQSYAILKKAAAISNFRLGKLNEEKNKLICTVCDEIINGMHDNMFPVGIWITGSGTFFNMNVNEVIANRASQLTNNPLGSKFPINPNDDANMSQSSNDTFPTAMHMSVAKICNSKLIPSLQSLIDALKKKAIDWRDIVKVGRTHLQDAVPIKLEQEISAFVYALEADLDRIKSSLTGIYNLTIGGTAIGTGINAPKNFDETIVNEISKIMNLPFKVSLNKFALQSLHDDLVHFSSSLNTLAVTLSKIANDIRILSCGPRAGIRELVLPENEPGSSIMPGKVNPTQCEAMTMVCAQVMANNVAVTLGGSGGQLQMNAYKPLIIKNILESLDILSDACVCFTKYMIQDMQPNLTKIDYYLQRSVMPVTILSTKIGYEKAGKIAKHAMENDLSLKEASLALGYISEVEFDEIVDCKKMT